jgi:hypothetical protein
VYVPSLLDPQRLFVKNSKCGKVQDSRKRGKVEKDGKSAKSLCQISVQIWHLSGGDDVLFI